MHDVALYNTTLSTIVNVHDVALYNTTLSTIVNMHDVALYNTTLSTIVNMHDVALYNTTLSIIVNMLLMWPYTTLPCQPLSTCMMWPYTTLPCQPLSTCMMSPYTTLPCQPLSTCCCCGPIQHYLVNHCQHAADVALYNITLSTIVNMHDVAQYNTTLSTIVNILLMWPYTTLPCQPLSTIVNIHAPEKTRRIPARPQPGWYNEDIRVEKQSRRQAERLWRKTRLTGHHDSKNDARKLFGIVNNLLGRRKLRYPPISLLVKLSIGSVDSSTTRSPTFIATSAAATALIRSVTYCHLYQPPWTHYPLCLLMSSSIS